MEEYIFSKEELEEIENKKENLLIGIGIMENHSEYNIKRNTRYPSGKIEIRANILESKIKY